MAIKNGNNEVGLVANGTNTDPSTWTCQRIDLNKPAQVNNCVKSGCPNDPKDVLCCVAGTGQTREQAGGSFNPQTLGPAPSQGFLPTCIDDGNCSLDDIVRTGVAVSKFLFGLSGAIFLGIFVYAGLLYILAGGGAERTKKAKTMLVQATIAIVIIFTANAVVWFVYVSFTQQPTKTAQACNNLNKTAKGQNFYSCQVLSGESERVQRGCLKQTDATCGSKDLFCCPLDAPLPQTTTKPAAGS